MSGQKKSWMLMRVNWKHFKYTRIMYYSDPQNESEVRAMKRGNWRAYNSLRLVLGYMLDIFDPEVIKFIDYLKSTFEDEYEVEEYKPTLKDKIYHRLFFRRK